MDKTALVWFDELRLTDFDQHGGWAALGRFNAKLADFADVTLLGSKSTVGWGAIDQKLSNRSRSDNQSYDISTSVELGKFFPDKKGIRIPMYINISNQTAMPQYDPGTPDVLLSQTLANAATQQLKDSIRNAAVDYTMRKSINFTNIHKNRTNPTKPARLWDIENFSATYAYTGYEHHDFNIQSELQHTYKVAASYTYINQPKYYAPLSKVIKSNLLAVFRDINYSLLPNRLNFQISFDRFYSENTLRNNDPNNFIAIPTTFNKSFNINRVYGIGWNLSKSLQIDIDATNLSVVDEPAGRINGLKRDTLWENLKKLGRTVNYNHTINFTYTTPINKLPGLDWTDLKAHYTTSFYWQSQPAFAINSANLNVGNTINNQRTIQLNPTLTFATLYNKFPFLRNANKNPDQGGWNKTLIGLLTSIKTITGAYTRTEGTTLPGYLPGSNLGGEDLSYNSPGIGFLLGSQADIRQKALNNGWITTDTLQNQLYTQTLNERIDFRSTIEPIHDLLITLIGLRTKDRNYQTNFKYLAGSGFQNLSPITSGDYSISYMTIGTAFSKPYGIDNQSSIFQKFLDARAVISQRLGVQNGNSLGKNATTGYYDGYSATSQNVLVPAFLAAYSGKDPNKVSLSSFPEIPIPNWDIKYNGLSRLPLFSEVFDALDITHGYRSSYAVNSFSSLIRYQEVNGSSYNRDVNNDFLPNYQFTQVSLLEQFVPLFGVTARFKNSVSANFEYRKTRSLSLSLLNSQLAQQNENILVFGMGYRTNHFRFPFGLFNNTVLKNDLNFKLDVALRDNKTLIYRSDIASAEISSGQKNITMRPSIDYVLSQRFTANIFYDSNITKPYTSQTFNTSVTNFGVNLKLLLQ